MDARCFANPRHSLFYDFGQTEIKKNPKMPYRDDEMGHIAILRDDFQPRDGVTVSYNVIEYMWAILLDPSVNKSSATRDVMTTYQGSS